MKILFENIKDSAAKDKLILIDESYEALIKQGIESTVDLLLGQIIDFNQRHRVSAAGEIVIPSIFQKPLNVIDIISALKDDMDISAFIEHSAAIFHPAGMELFLSHQTSIFRDEYSGLSDLFDRSLLGIRRLIASDTGFGESDPVFCRLKQMALTESSSAAIVELAPPSMTAITDEILAQNLADAIIKKYAAEKLREVCLEKKAVLSQAVLQEKRAEVQYHKARAEELAAELVAARQRLAQSEARLTRVDEAPATLRLHDLEITINTSETAIPSASVAPTSATNDFSLPEAAAARRAESP